MKLLLRIFISPLILGVIIIGLARNSISRLFLFIAFGGEFIIYEKKNQKKIIHDLYYLLEDKLKEDE